MAAARNLRIAFHYIAITIEPLTQDVWNILCRWVKYNYKFYSKHVSVY